MKKGKQAFKNLTSNKLSTVPVPSQIHTFSNQDDLFDDQISCPLVCQNAKALKFEAKIKAEMALRISERRHGNINNNIAHTTQQGNHLNTPPQPPPAGSDSDSDSSLLNKISNITSQQSESESDSDLGDLDELESYFKS